MLNLCKSRRGNGLFSLLNNTECAKACGVDVIRRGTWNLAEQQAMALEKGFCSIVHDGRICGRAKAKRGDGYARKRCRKCKPLQDTMTEDEFCKTVHIPSRRVVITPTAQPQATTSRGTQWHVMDQHDMKGLYERGWPEGTVSKGTRRNARTCVMRKLLPGLGLGPNDTKLDLHESLDKLSVIEFMNVVKSLRDAVNVTRYGRKFMRLAERPREIALLSILQSEYENVSCGLTDAERTTLEALAISLSVNLETSVRPGRDLLHAMQVKLLSCQPEETVEALAFAADSLLGLWLPAHRGNLLAFTWGRRVPKMECTKNVAVLRDGECVGLFFGDLKFTKSKVRSKETQFYLTREGLTTREGTFVPCHMTPADFEDWITQLLCTFTQARNLHKTAPSGKRVFRRTFHLAKITEAFWGVPVNVFLRRKIFRNGVEDTDENFMRYVMQHSEMCDKKKYLKRELMYGPWQKCDN